MSRSRNSSSAEPNRFPRPLSSSFVVLAVVAFGVWTVNGSRFSSATRSSRRIASDTDKPTDKGRIEIAESLRRGEYAQEIMERNGVTMREYYLTIGAYDFVLIFDAQHEQGMAQTLVEIGRLGAICTQTMLAFGKEPYAEIQERPRTGGTEGRTP